MEWFRFMRAAHARGERQSFMMFNEVGDLLGVTSLDITPEHGHAELAYALAIEHWGKGYATEAAREVVDFGFETLGLERVHAAYYTRNAASGRVLEKLGFRPEGVRPRMYFRFGEWLDLALVRVLREEWEAARR
jgi:RimJ/RimL family protein N-acetyltransferase